MNIAIYGYGNLGKGVELAVSNSPDMNLVGIFTRRELLIKSNRTDEAVEEEHV